MIIKEDNFFCHFWYNRHNSDLTFNTLDNSLPRSYVFNACTFY